MWERMKEKRNEGGFTLIELLIVIIILAILAAIVVFAVGTTGTNATLAACKADYKSVETAAEAYKAQIGSYAPSIDALTTTIADPINTTVTDGPWLRDKPSSTKYTITYASDGSVTSSLAGCPV